MTKSCRENKKSLPAAKLVSSAYLPYMGHWDTKQMQFGRLVCYAIYYRVHMNLTR